MKKIQLALKILEYEILNSCKTDFLSRSDIIHTTNSYCTTNDLHYLYKNGLLKRKSRNNLYSNNRIGIYKTTFKGYWKMFLYRRQRSELMKMQDYSLHKEKYYI